MSNNPLDVCKYWLNAIINEADDKLTDWERDFIYNVKLKLDNNVELTTRQEWTLKEIFEKRC
jgi:hypothetical protein